MSATTIAELQAKLRGLLPELSQSYGVSGFWIFGSYARGEAVEASDVDVLVEFEGSKMTLIKFVELEHKIADRLGRPVDLVQKSALHPRIKDRVLSEAIAV